MITLLFALLFGRSDVSVASSATIRMIVAPNRCPRCESMIPGIFELASYYKPTARKEVILVVSGKREFEEVLRGETGSYYSGMDRLYADSSGVLEQRLLRYNNLPIVEISNAQDSIIYERPLLGINVAYEAHNPLVAALLGTSMNIAPLRRVARQPIGSDSERLGEPLVLALHPSRPYAFVLDLLSLRTKRVNYLTGKIENRYDVPYSARAQYSRALGDSAFAAMEATGKARTMCFTPMVSATGDSIVIHTSLPVLTEQTSSGASQLSIRAMNPLLTFKLDGDYVSTDSLKMPPSPKCFTLLGTTYDRYHHLYVVPLEKIRPEYKEELPAELDPSTDSFYRDAPLVALYDDAKRLVGYAGGLDSIYHRLRLGYNNCMVTTASSADHLYIFHTLSNLVVDYVHNRTYTLDPPGANDVDSLERPNGFRWKMSEIATMSRCLPWGIWSAAIGPNDHLYVVWHKSLDPSGRCWQPIIQEYQLVDNGKRLALISASSIPVGEEMVRGVFFSPTADKVFAFKHSTNRDWVDTYETH